MLCGLQGTGKTTTAGKLARLLKRKMAKKVLLVAGDVYRPAAIDQLNTISKQVGVDFFSLGDKVNPVEISKQAVKKAAAEKYDVVIIDTAGRLQIDEKLMDELVNIQSEVKPDEVLLLVDAMSGQEAVNVAKAFNDKLKLTGMIMSKLDGDSRGGAALSIKHLTGVPIKYIGVGEKLEDLEVFHPDRMADRILGMGDVVSLVEKVSEEIDEKEAKKTVNKMMSGNFTLNDMLSQLEQVKKFANSKFLKLIPGMSQYANQLDTEKMEKRIKVMKAIIDSMTLEEREHPEILKNSRKMRIASGSGTSNQEINQVLKQFEMMKQQMKDLPNMMKSGKMQSMMNNLNNLKKDVDWIIVSGGYGVISSNTLISPYDDDMMKITRKNMKSLKSFLRFTEDTGEIVKQGYDEIIFCVSDRWLCNIDLDYVRECSPNSRFILFPAKGFKGSIPNNSVEIYPTLNDCSRLKSIIIWIKEKITADYLNSGKGICEYLDQIEVKYKIRLV